jgi:site-specific DNA-methyltransferase (adenine-specific)/site-specific DNA-methyltransferase (cytosine-N4-specific)
MGWTICVRTTEPGDDQQQCGDNHEHQHPYPPEREEKATMIYIGDTADVLTSFEDDSIDLIATSPPYAAQRKNTYGGIHPDKYVEWFMPISKELKRVLKPTGSFILNIKESVHKGERHPYVLNLVLAMREQGWLWTEEYIWHKRNCFPGKWSNRFRDAWEHIHHFTKQRKFAMYQDEVRVPIGDWSISRLKSLSETDKIRDPSRVNLGFGKKVSNWVGRELVYPTNVLYEATECGNQQHSAAFPLWLPEWFIKLFTRELGVVLDPFLGSGTTAVAAKKLGRRYIGIEKIEEYAVRAEERLRAVGVTIFVEGNLDRILIAAYASKAPESTLIYYGNAS